jgi:lambda family phage minor tail protein L
VRAPKRQCISNICQWKYRSAECGYVGTSYFNENDQSVATLAADVCGKRLSSCKARFGTTAELPFGSYPGVGTFFT